MIAPPGRKSSPAGNRGAKSQQLGGGIDVSQRTPTTRLFTGDSPLSESETSELLRHEEVVDRGVGAFIAVGSALLRIREDRLYRATHPTFSAYCQDRFPQLSRSSVYRAIDTAIVTDIVSPTGDVPNDAQIRELAPLRDRPEALRQAWQKTVESTGGQPTAAAVRNMVANSRSARSKPEQIRTFFGTEEGRRRLSEFSPAKPRRSLPDAFFEATFDLMKIIERLERLVGDDRLARNRSSIAAKHAEDIARARRHLDTVAQRLGGVDAR